MAAYQRGAYIIDTDPSRLDVEASHASLARAYSVAGIPKDVVARSLQHSLCFGVYYGTAQVGPARVITDRDVRYVRDVSILEAHQRKGLGTWLLCVVRSHAALQHLRRWNLATRTAHGLYRQFGFTDLIEPERWMELAMRGAIPH